MIRKGSVYKREVPPLVLYDDKGRARELRESHMNYTCANGKGSPRAG